MTSVDSSPGNELGPVSEWEELGRYVLSRSHRRKAANTGIIPYQVFLEHLGEQKISVDRVSCATPDDAAAIARRVAEQRVPARNFYGWAVVDAEQVLKVGCGVEHSPLDDNPYHADIVLPNSITENFDEQEQYATTLAGMSEWRPYPPEPQENAG